MPIVKDAPLWRTGAFWHALVSVITALGLLFPEWDAKVKVAIVLVQQLATLFVVDRVVYQADPRTIPPGVVFVERDGVTPAPKKTLAIGP